MKQREYVRHNEERIVTEVGEHRVNFDSWSWPRSIFPDDVAVGDRFIIQSVLGSTPSGVFRATWYKTDEDLDADHKAMVKKHDEDRQARLEANQEEWSTREMALPPALQARLQNFREKGTNFDADGWGYELVIAELAVMYAKQEAAMGNDPFTDTDEILEFARNEGTSGNQHDFARALARALVQDPESLGQTVSALSPLGSGAFYDAKEES